MRITKVTTVTTLHGVDKTTTTTETQITTDGPDIQGADVSKTFDAMDEAAKQMEVASAGFRRAMADVIHRLGDALRPKR